MMVNPYDDSRLMLALQIDHSRVAGFFAAHWGNQDFAKPEPYASVVLAAHEHDIGWWEWEMKPSTLNDKGFPMDYHDGSFKYLGQLRLDFYKNAVDRVLKRDPYAALLMAMHGVALMNAGYGKYAYPPDRTGDPRVKAYVEDQEQLRVKLVAELRQSERSRSMRRRSGYGPTTNTWRCSTSWRSLSAIAIRSTANGASWDRRIR